MSGDGTLFAVRKPYDDILIYFFQKQEFDDGTSWKEMTGLRLVSDDNFGPDNFGSAVSFSEDGKRVAIGADQADTYSGSVSVYETMGTSNNIE
eukprot:scaffold3579_cov168-Cylindrotheca_fusiformis.AAC.7